MVNRLVLGCGAMAQAVIAGLLDDRLAEIGSWFDLAGETRGLGLMRGLELVEDGSKTPAKGAATRIQERLRDDHDVIVGVGGYHKNVLRIQPPLTIGREALERAVGAIESAIAAEAG